MTVVGYRRPDTGSVERLDLSLEKRDRSLATLNLTRDEQIVQHYYRELRYYRYRLEYESELLARQQQQQ